jgi:inhibitor of KinA sporulation pathway (predicted exonuclease)
MKNKNYVIFDLEATCYDKGEQAPDGFQNEIIEIGAVKLNENGEIIDKFSKFTKPLLFPQLSKFCTDLTSITQEDVDNAEPLKDIIKEFIKWKGNDPLISWGGYDKTQLIRDLVSNDLENLVEDINPHYNFKFFYSKWNLLKKGVGMKKALNRENINLIGTHHRGIDDAINISEIFIKYIDLFDLTSKYTDMSFKKFESKYQYVYEMASGILSENTSDRNKVLIFRTILGRYNNPNNSKEILGYMISSLEPFKEMVEVNGYFKSLERNLKSNIKNKSD